MFSRSPAWSSTSSPGWALAQGHFLNAFWIMIVANIFDFIDGKVAIETGAVSRVRRLLGLGHRPLLGSRAVGRPDLPLRVARAAPTTCSSRRFRWSSRR